MWLDGLGSALIGGVVAAITAFAVVRWQIRADRAHTRRYEDIRIAVSLQRSAARFAFAMADYSSKRPRTDLDVALLDVWAFVSEAQCQRPDDRPARDWMSSLQRALIARTDRYVKGSMDVELRDAHIQWVNENAQAIASYLEDGSSLGRAPTPS